MSRKRSNIVRGRTLFVSTLVVLMSSEFVAICISGFVMGSFTPRQALGFAVVEGGALFIYMGEHGARRIVGLALLGIAAWGTWHLARFPRSASVPTVLLAIQTSMRLAGSLVLLRSGAVADYTERLERAGGGGRRARK